ncbi:hypothetical protein [Rufibacter immobilis]|uniref:hypothetical protein n=1 Tax=Rufibacter immobilis TaxID=1348778 RepID=UPI0035F0395C
MRVLILVFLLISTGAVAQSKQDSLLIVDGSAIIQEMKLMWNYDQAVREYIQYQTFDKHKTDSIEALPAPVKERILDSLKLTKSYSNKVWDNYIIPFDHLHTKRMIEIIKKYGFPSNSRIEKLLNYKMEFHTYMILLHSPKEYAQELIALVTTEHKNGNFPNKCLYGHLLWHLNGRSDMKYFLENGYVFEKQPDGQTTLVPKNCE